MKGRQVTDEVATAENLIGGSVSNELSSNRTAMSFDRTALSSDRTLMSVVRTSLSLIGFGFTIFQFFHKLADQFLKGLPPEAPRRFGLALIVLGVILLTVGIYNHAHETHLRRLRRQNLFDLGLIRHPEIKRPNSAMIIAILLLIVGLLAVLRVGLSIGPF
jgi:putative membrane protein